MYCIHFFVKSAHGWVCVYDIKQQKLEHVGWVQFALHCLTVLKFPNKSVPFADVPKD